MGLDMLFKWVESMVSQANAANMKFYDNAEKPEGKWKHCIALSKLGWEFMGFEPILEDKNDAVMSKWRKEDKEIEFRLGFPDRCVWLEYLRQKGEK